jgi:hypothetical protein
LRRAFGEALLAAQAHVDLAPTEAALPWKQAQQRKQGTLDDALTRQATKLLMTAVWTETHKNSSGPDDVGRGPIESDGRIP